MSAILEVINQARILDNTGVEAFAKQGAAADRAETPFEVTVTGSLFRQVATLPTANIATLWTAANDLPAMFAYGFLWTDQAAFLQRIGSATNAVDPITAEVPFTFGGTILGAGTTTLISAGAPPSVTALSKIVLGNYSGVTLNYSLLLVL